MKGSHATYGGWEPRVCEDCGKHITLTGKNARGAFFRYDVERRIGRARHADCNWRATR